MKPPDPTEEISLTETKVLAALAEGTTDGSIQDVARAFLGQYRWHDSAHQIIFEALMTIPSENVETIRSQLPARLTRMGFPDLDWETLYAMPRLSRAEAERLIESLAR